MSLVRSGMPWASIQCCSHSLLSRAMSTFDGHSLLQPLQERHRSITSASSGVVQGLAPGLPAVEASAWRRTFARARVVSFSSRVAM